MSEKISVVGEPKLPVEDQEVDVDSIVDELEDEIEEEESEAAEVPQAQTPAPAFDINQLTEEQLQELAARLSATPQRSSAASKYRTIKLREYRGEIVVDFKNAYMGLLDDPENRRQVERHLIPIRVKGSSEYIDIPWTQFMELPQVDCQILDQRQKQDVQTVGQTYDEHDKLVEMHVTKVFYWFTVKLPSGEEIEIEGKVANG